jgi:putative colanic acid biosynthesis glycosyltransferase
MWHIQAMLFSIITITYNNLGGLKNTYDSVSKQICKDYEWIVIDGASDDGSTEYLDKISADYTSEPDKGIYDAMNKGIERAKGDFAIFMNAGDIFASEGVLEQIKRDITKQGKMLDFIYGDSLENLGKVSADTDNLVYKKARSHKNATYGLFTHHQAMLYKREKIGSLRYDLKYDIAADYKFTLQFLKKSETVFYCPYAICVFEQGGVSQKQVTKGRAEQFKIRIEERAGPLARNILIYCAQSMVMALRNFMPSLYWKLKQKSRQALN